MADTYWTTFTSSDAMIAAKSAAELLIQRKILLDGASCGQIHIKSVTRKETLFATYMRGVITVTLKVSPFEHQYGRSGFSIIVTMSTFDGGDYRVTEVSAKSVGLPEGEIEKKGWR